MAKNMNKNARLKMELFKAINDHLSTSGIIEAFQEEAFQYREEQKKKSGNYKPDTAGNIKRFRRISELALRCEMARILSGNVSFREMEVKLTFDQMLKEFCKLKELRRPNGISKSTLERYSKWIPEERLNKITRDFLQKISKEVDCSTVFFDSTCVKANIHHPTDWVFILDEVKTLMQAIMLIRKKGLKNRMPKDPKDILSKGNKLSMEMAGCNRQKRASRARSKQSAKSTSSKDSNEEKITRSRKRKSSRKKYKKYEKKILRKMIKLLVQVKFHAIKHRDLLAQYQQESGYTKAEAKRIIERINAKLDQIDFVIKQAKARIIRGKPLSINEKIYSIHDSEIGIVKKGKAGVSAEFGNVLLLGESSDGLIVDWKFCPKQAPADSIMLLEALERWMTLFSDELSRIVVGDRGFDSKKNRCLLEKKGITNAICPRNPSVLKEQLQEKSFCKYQKRRASTEARIAIFKNNFLGKPLRSKGFKNRELAVTWNVLTHNFCLLARMKLSKQERQNAA